MNTRFLFLYLFCLTFIFSCKKDVIDPEPEPEPEIPMVKLTQNGTLGNILTDHKGKTLYIFSNDAGATSTCTGTCLENWPVYYIQDLKLGTGLDAADFGTIEGTSGKQTTYKGWPLYYYKNDAAAGQTNGEAVAGNWWVAKPDYSIMYVNAQLKGADGVNYKGDYTLGDGLTKYFVDEKGRTLYGFARDNFGKNNFTKSDFSNNSVWPIYEETLEAIPSTLSKADFSTIDVFGKKQLAYKGWPLYYFGADNAVKGSNKGVSFPSPGIWPVINENVTSLPKEPKVVLANDAVLGSFMTDQDGKTLYFFSRDAADNSACSGGCATTWPAYHLTNIAVGPGLNAADFGEIVRPDGAKQTTYKGWPLYYFSGDTQAGEKKGEAVNNVWWIAKPNYTIMQVSAQLVGHDGKQYKSDYTEGTGNTIYFVDGLGRTLYGFVNDAFDDNNFTKEDFSNNGVWPIYEVASLASIPSTLNKNDFNIITVFGKKQLTYKGWPLYYFGNDGNVRGANKGISFPSPGIWPILNGSSDYRNCDAKTVTYSGFIKSFISTTCATSFCHGGSAPAGGLALGDYNVLKTTAASGRLYGAISDTQGFSPMPKDNPKLDGCTIAKIKSWIDAGALDN